MHELSLAIDQDFTPSVCTYLIDSLNASCTDAARRFHEEIGCNATTFGMDSYHFAVFQFRDGLRFEPAGVLLGPTSTELEFRLQIGRFRTAVHRVGSHAADPIETSFPSSLHGPGKLARENAFQLNLDLPGTYSSMPTNVIVAYMSNPVRGLEAVYVCVPVGSTEAGKIKEWVYTKCIWRSGENEIELPPTQDFPPAVPNPPAGIKLRPETLVKE